MGNLLATICDDTFGDVLYMVFEDDCLVFKKGNDTLAKWCEFKNLFYVLDGYDLINSILKPQQILEVYNNDGALECPDTDPTTGLMGDITGRTPDELKDKLYAKGVFLMIKYPTVNAGGGAVDDADNNCEMRLSNFTLDTIDTIPEPTYQSQEIVLPIYTFYSLLNNPSCKDITKMTNYLRIQNTTSNNVTVTGVVLYVDSGNKDYFSDSC